MRAPRLLSVVRCALASTIVAAAFAAPGVVLASSAAAMQSARLIDEADYFDGKSIIYDGEAIGEAMTRNTHAWLHINDDGYQTALIEEGGMLRGLNSGMAVWIDASEVDKIDSFGDHKNVGTRLRIHGIFNAACAAHGGDMDIHANSLEVLEAGRRVAEDLRPEKLAAAMLLAIATLFTLLVAPALQRRRDQGLQGLVGSFVAAFRGVQR